MAKKREVQKREVDLVADAGYADLLAEVRAEVRQARVRAARAVNAELIGAYWRIGRMILDRQEAEGWGAKVVDQLAADLRADGAKGFSRANLQFMRKFAETWPELDPTRTANVSQAVRQIPWGHNRVLLTKLANNGDRLWYAERAASEGWSRQVLEHNIATRLKARAGAAANNFPATIAAPDSDLASELLTDPLDLSFVAGEKIASEADLEDALVKYVERFMLATGGGKLSFVGRQYPLIVGGDEFFIDLLFFHVELLSYIVVELKIGKFVPEFSGKLNFYVNVVNDQLRSVEKHGPTIGILLCAELNDQVVRYSVDGLDSPMTVKSYALKTEELKQLPAPLRGQLPATEQLQANLKRMVDERREDVEALLEEDGSGNDE
jgi:predicted nuclease of restriction endonuclease-like (RecB) superfamily